jgi:hypothetical protein
MVGGFSFPYAFGNVLSGRRRFFFFSRTSMEITIRALRDAKKRKDNARMQDGNDTLYGTNRSPW